MGCLELGLKCGNFYNIDVGAGYGCGSAEDENFRNAYFQAAMAIKLDNKYCGGPKMFLLDHDLHLQCKGCNPNSVVDYWIG